MGDEKEYSWSRLLLDIEEEIDRWLEDNPDTTDVDEIDETLFELADSHTPVYNYDRAMYLADNLWLGCTESELSDSREVFDLLGAVIYEELRQHGWEYASQQIDNLNEEREYQLTEEEE